jgi:hypothetical protein
VHLAVCRSGQDLELIFQLHPFNTLLIGPCTHRQVYEFPLHGRTHDSVACCLLVEKPIADVYFTISVSCSSLYKLTCLCSLILGKIIFFVPQLFQTYYVVLSLNPFDCYIFCASFLFLSPPTDGSHIVYVKNHSTSARNHPEAVRGTKLIRF